MRQYKVTFKVKSFVISPVFLMISSRIFLTCISPVVFSRWGQKFIKLNFSCYLPTQTLELLAFCLILALTCLGPNSFGPQLISEPRKKFNLKIAKPRLFISHWVKTILYLWAFPTITTPYFLMLGVISSQKNVWNFSWQTPLHQLCRGIFLLYSSWMIWYNSFKFSDIRKVLWFVYLHLMVF